MPWHEVSDWLQAVGTLVALVFAAVAAKAARGAFRIESERDRITAEDRRRQEAYLRRGQAALVSAWWGEGPDGEGTGGWGAYVRNASETPVYQAQLSVVHHRDPDLNEDIPLAVVPPAASPVFHPSRSTTGRDSADAAVDHRVEMTFTDSAGIRWIRDQQGRLSEVLPEVTIWADDQRAATLDRYAADFLNSHQVTVRFRTYPIEVLLDTFLAAVAAGEAADILVGPHDWIGYLVDRDAIDAIGLSERRREAFSRYATGAMAYRGQLYGVPYAADSICLMRNLDLAPHPPATMDELIAHGQRLCAAGRAEVPVALQVGTGDCFYVYPLFVSAGGRLFAADGSGWDPAAMTGTGSAAAFARLGALGERGDGILRSEIDRDRAMNLFAEGRTPYLVCAAWAVGVAREAGVRLGVSPMPPLRDGAPTRSLVAVHGFYLASAGANKSIAQDLVVDYLTRSQVALDLYAAQPRTPALRSALAKVVAEDTLAAPFHEQCERGDLIPSTADSAAMFTLFHQAEVAVVSGADPTSGVRTLGQSLSRLP
jgi:maltose-binding protein MalE